MKHNLYLWDGVKAQSIDDLDQWMDATQKETSDTHGVYAAVPWVYRCVRLRANALASMPHTLTKADKPVEYPLDYMLPHLLWLTEAMLCVYGAAYWLRQKNRAQVEGYRCLIPTSIKIKSDENTGLTGFERKVSGTKTITYKPEELVYFWEPNLQVEIGPGVSPTQCGLEDAGLARYATEFASGFFKRGAIPATLLQIEGNPPEPERKRLEDWWNGMLQGVRHAWQTVAIKAMVKFQVITPPIKDLAMQDLTESARQKIAVAFGVPQTMLEDAANYATAAEHRLQFYENTVVPECDLIAATLNEQVFAPQGLTFAFQPEQLDIFQEDEAKRAASLKVLTEAGVPLVLAMQMLGYELPEEWTYERLEEELNPPEPEPTPVTTAGETEAPALPTGAPVAEAPVATAGNDNGNGEMMADLRRWRRKSLAHKGGLVGFDSDHIPAQTAQLIQAMQPWAGAALWGFLKAPPDARSEVEKKLARLLGGVFGENVEAIIGAIMGGTAPDFDPLKSALRGVLLEVLSGLVAETVLRITSELRIQFDPAVINHRAFEWAKVYAGNLVKEIAGTTHDLVRDVISQFVATPGMTSGDVTRLLLPAFDEKRAKMIAVTETTRAYSEATNETQELLREQGLTMDRIFNTSNDEKVCEICGPLNGEREQDWEEKLGDAWNSEYSKGPPLHPNCRCDTSLRVHM